MRSRQHLGRPGLPTVGMVSQAGMYAMAGRNRVSGIYAPNPQGKWMCVCAIGNEKHPNKLGVSGQNFSLCPARPTNVHGGPARSAALIDNSCLQMKG